MKSQFNPDKLLGMEEQKEMLFLPFIDAYNHHF
jgi:hypothetical protein